jgi:integrase
VELRDRRPICSACQESKDAEKRYLDAALRYADDPQFDRAYTRSEGLCVPHVVRALELGSTGLAEPLVTRTVQKWEALRKDLRGFIEKHDYRNTAAFTEAEGLSYLRAFEAVAGAPGVFGNDIQLRSRSQRRAPSRSDRALDWPASPEDLAAFDRSKLELRVKELSEQLGDATTRAAALHYRLAQVAEDLERQRMPFSDDAVRVFLTNLKDRDDTMQWIGRILFYSGMRLAEAGNLRGRDVQTREGVVGFSVEPGEGVSVKTPTAVRFVPAHSVLLKAGIVELAQKRGRGFLFNLQADVHGKRTSVLSKAFARYLRSHKLDQGGRVVMHSARHTVADKLRESNTQEAIISAILGHSNRTSQTAGYGRGWSPKVMREAVETIRYEGGV